MHLVVHHVWVAEKQILCEYKLVEKLASQSDGARLAWGDQVEAFSTCHYVPVFVKHVFKPTIGRDDFMVGVPERASKLWAILRACTMCREWRELLTALQRVEYVLGNRFIGTGYRCKNGFVKVASPRGRASWTEHVLHR